MPKNVNTKSFWQKIREDAFDNSHAMNADVLEAFYGEEERIHEQFKREALAYVNLTDHPSADDAFSVAWENTPPTIWGYDWGAIVNLLTDIAGLLGEGPDVDESGERQSLDFDVMSVYRERTTGLEGLIVYCAPYPADDHADDKPEFHYVPHIKLLERSNLERRDHSLEYDAVVSIEPEPRWLKGSITAHRRSAVDAWVRANREALMAYWAGEIEDCVELAERFKRYPG